MHHLLIIHRGIGEVVREGKGWSRDLRVWGHDVPGICVLVS